MYMIRYHLLIVELETQNYDNDPENTEKHV